VGEAIRLYEQNLADYERLQSPDHPRTWAFGPVAAGQVAASAFAVEG
jgi:hypothetical protein